MASGYEHHGKITGSRVIYKTLKYGRVPSTEIITYADGFIKYTDLISGDVYGQQSGLPGIRPGQVSIPDKNIKADPTQVQRQPQSTVVSSKYKQETPVNKGVNYYEYECKRVDF